MKVTQHWSAKFKINYVQYCAILFKRTYRKHFGLSKISILKLENRFIYTKFEGILFEEMRRIDLLWKIVKYTASLL